MSVRDEGGPDEQKVLERAREYEVMQQTKGWELFMEEMGDRAVTSVANLMADDVSDAEMRTELGRLREIVAIWGQVDGAVSLSRYIAAELERRTREANAAAAKRRNAVDGRAAIDAHHAGVL